jgi:hypothetical protein
MTTLRHERVHAPVRKKGVRGQGQPYRWPRGPEAQGSTKRLIRFFWQVVSLVTLLIAVAAV